MTLSLQRKLLSIALATCIFTTIALIFAVILGVPIDQSGVGALAIGLLVSGFEEFYVQGRSGRWLRAIHPVRSLAVYSVIIVVFFLMVMHLNHWVFGRWDRLDASYARLPVVIPLFFVVAIAAITVLRVVGFLGARNLLYLMIGRYHRPVVEWKVFLFLDIKESTAVVERLGPVRTRALIGKFFFDISKPITDHGGEIYKFTGDGVVATWDWKNAFVDNRLLRAIDAIHKAVEGERPFYEDTFGHHPAYRVGVHGGEIVTSEEGDIKRAIGYYGETIHIAARMEQKAKELGVDCVLSEEVVQRLHASEDRVEPIGGEPVRGISEPIAVFRLLPPRGSAADTP